MAALKNPVNSIQSVQSHNSTTNVVRYSEHLKPGSPVLVRIIQSKGNGKYEASVAGVRIILSSKIKYNPGDTFTGKIGIKNSTILIETSHQSNQVQIKDFLTTNINEGGNLFETVSSPVLASLLSSLNLPKDNLSFKILLQFKQLGMKLDSKTMRKIRNRAEQSPSPEKEIEELTVKIQKGIDPFAEINTEKNQTEKKDIPQNQNSEDYTFTTETDYLSEIKKFLNRIISGNLPNLNGELTIMNHLGFFKNKTGENSWITIPFEIVNLLENETKGDGKIMILLGSSDKSFRQMNLNVKYSETEYRFAVFAKAGSKEIRNIDFSVSGNPVPDKECKKLREAFSDSKNIIPVEFVPFEKMEGFASSLENFSFIEGNA